MNADWNLDYFKCHNIKSLWNDVPNLDQELTKFVVPAPDQPDLKLVNPLPDNFVPPGGAAWAFYQFTDVERICKDVLGETLPNMLACTPGPLSHRTVENHLSEPHNHRICVAARIGLKKGKPVAETCFPSGVRALLRDAGDDCIQADKIFDSGIYEIPTTIHVPSEL